MSLRKSLKKKIWQIISVISTVATCVSRILTEYHLFDVNIGLC